jgi:hypothetical protein
MFALNRYFLCRIALAPKSVYAFGLAACPIDPETRQNHAAAGEDSNERLAHLHPRSISIHLYSFLPCCGLYWDRASPIIVGKLGAKLVDSPRRVGALSGEVVLSIHARDSKDTTGPVVLHASTAIVSPDPSKTLPEPHVNSPKQEFSSDCLPRLNIAARAH